MCDGADPCADALAMFRGHLEPCHAAEQCARVDVVVCDEHAYVVEILVASGRELARREVVNLGAHHCNLGVSDGHSQAAFFPPDRERRGFETDAVCVIPVRAMETRLFAEAAIDNVPPFGMPIRNDVQLDGLAKLDGGVRVVQKHGLRSKDQQLVNLAARTACRNSSYVTVGARDWGASLASGRDGRRLPFAPPR
jgi:hypothetical protein